jgi:hypothetical protein
MGNIKHDNTSGIKQHAAPDAECPRNAADIDYHCKVTEPEYLLKTHDLSALSRYYLDVTAFTPRVSMGAATKLHDSKLNITETYNSIREASHSSNFLINTGGFSWKDHPTPDFDRMGIICEYKDKYCVVFEASRCEADNDEDTIRTAWVDKRLVGMHLISEWNSLSTWRANEHYIFATGSTCGWWHPHSKILMLVRRFVARRLRSQPKLTDKYVAAYLVGPVCGDVLAVYRAARMRKEELAREAESAMREFTVVEEQD